MLKILFNNNSFLGGENIIYETHSKISGRIVVKDSYQGRELVINSSTHSIKLKISRANYWEYVVKYSAVKDGDKILILGLGGGEIVRRLLKNYSVKIDVVELDWSIIDVYQKYFMGDFVSKDNLKIIEGDAYDYVIKNKKKYNIIISDIYFNGEYPSDFEEDTFIRKVNKSLFVKGQFISNRIYTFKSKDRIREYTFLLKHYFLGVYVKYVGDAVFKTQNYVFFANK